jgi:protein-S-isoprenylcysteine O-methyltransferase Ste14
MSESTWHTVANVAIIACWGAFAAVWIIGAVFNARRSPAVRTRTMGRVQLLIAGAAAWAVLLLVPDSDWERLTIDAGWIRWLGLVLLVASTVFIIRARFSLGLMWSSDVIAREDHQLRTDGPYGMVRHPIYTGLLGMLLGSALLDGPGRWTIGLVLGGVIVLLKVRAEERLMGKVFPGEYERYRRRVPALVPHPWRH